MKALFHTIVARLHGLLRSRSLDSDFDQELEAHLAGDGGQDPAGHDAGRSPPRRTRGIGRTDAITRGRTRRGLPWLETFGLDVRLGLRMLRKSWGLTLIGGLAMAVAIGIGATAFTVLDTLEGNTLPVEEGDRLVRLVIYRVRGNKAQD